MRIKIVLLVLSVQCALVLASALLTLAFNRSEMLSSVLYGGAMGMVTTVYFALRMLAPPVVINQPYAIRSVALTLISKYALVVVLLYFGLKKWHLLPWPLIASFALVQVAYWLSLLLTRNR